MYVRQLPLSLVPQKLKGSVRFPETGVKDVYNPSCGDETGTSARIFNDISH